MQKLFFSYEANFSYEATWLHMKPNFFSYLTNKMFVIPKEYAIIYSS